ncbi:hypothetical protein A4G99_11685 [Haladaptatus sp. R4]|uniref:DUF7127 family protein n=1 Tax=Haladaptatus sp. R4 TaxID=1679489 RepID=UPI0007B45CC5|nr:hypothetical protein [Haladaptatus sp. R4]KZN23559.1 hypothetical protein A4G99_11685 [Haladaptatus sp. R4]
MTLEHISQQEDSIARRYDYDDGELIVADFGTADVSVDVLDDVAIVVVERDGDSFQTEIELSADDAQAFINNGVLTIEVGQ